MEAINQSTYINTVMMSRLFRHEDTTEKKTAVNIRYTLIYITRNIYSCIFLSTFIFVVILQFINSTVFIHESN